MQCDDSLKARIEAHLEGFEIKRSQDSDLRRAAVAVVVTDVGPGTDLPGIDDDDGWSSIAALMLTRRSGKLREHPGQWAFPGGRVDPGETLVEAATQTKQQTDSIKASGILVLD